jgi:hypothetical protein
MTKTDSFLSLLDSPFSRRGSFFALANDNLGEDILGKSTLWISNCRIIGTDVTTQNNGFRQVKIELIKNGKALPCEIFTTPYEVILSSLHGTVRFCIGERKLLMARGEDGLGLRITPTPKFLSPTAVNMFDGTYQVDFRATRLLLVPLSGTLALAAPTYLEITPDGDGVLQLAFEEYTSEPEHRPTEKYPTYAECVADVKRDFDGFCASVAPGLPAQYETKRLQALWCTWNMLVDPDGETSYKHTMVKMIHSLFEAAFVWQQPMQAVWLSSDLKLAWEIFYSAFDHQSVDGRIIDALGFNGSQVDAMKPPVHGLALLWLMDNCDLSGVSAESKEFVWQGLVRWTEFFMKFRDRNRDGIAEYQSILETGWEDAPYFSVGFPCATPDLNAFLALQMEAVARLGRDIGKPADVCDEWQERSEALVKKIVERFWDGESWFAYNSETGEKSDSATVALYITLLLGKRLPGEIIDKSVKFIFSEDGFNTPYGLATESPKSEYFTHQFTRGSIIPPAEFLMCLALEACGESELAKKVANEYAAILRDHGFFHIHNAVTGNEDRTLTGFGERGLFWSAWASSCYLYLARVYG